MKAQVQRRSQWAPGPIRDWGSEPLRLEGEPEWVVRGDPASLAAIQQALGGFSEVLAPEVLVLSFGNSVGMFRVPGLGPLIVTSGKWDEADFERMLSDVSRISASLPFTSGEQAKLAAERAFTGEGRVPFHQYLYLRHILSSETPREDQAGPALSAILADPHRRFVREPRVTRLEQVSRVDPASVFRAYTRPGGVVRAGGAMGATALARAAGGLVPVAFEEQRAEETFDTAENRLVLAFLEVAARICSSVRDDARRRNAGSLAAEADGLLGLLQPHRRARLWDDVGRMEQLPAASTVLHGRRGYRDVFRHYLRLMQAPVWLPLDPEEAQELVEAKDIAKLYELWCFFRVVEGVTAVLGPAASALMVVVDEREVRVRRGLAVEWDGVSVLYNRSFSRSAMAPFRSYSAVLAPDVCLVVTERTTACAPDGAGAANAASASSGSAGDVGPGPGPGLAAAPDPAGPPRRRVYLFDAKFKLREVPTRAYAEPEDEALERTQHTADDLNKMHTYRDATGAEFALVLYPGTESVLFRPDGSCERGGAVASAPHAGVGAISLAPGAASPLMTLIGGLIGSGGKDEDEGRS